MPTTIGIDVSPLARDAYTGTEWYTFNLITTLQKLPEAKNVTWVLYSPVKKPDNITLLPNWQWKRLSWPLRRFWISVRLSYEIIIHPPTLLFVPANKLPLILPSKVATTIHDVAFEETPNLYSVHERRRQHRALLRVIARASLIFTISQSTKTNLENYFPDKKNFFSLIKLAVDSESLRLKTAKSSRPMKEKYMIFIGTLNKKKNIIYLIDIFETLAKKGLESKLILLGKPGYGSDKIKKRIKNSTNYNKIVVLPWTDEMKHASFLAHADALIIPSIAEGFSLPILEAQHESVPLLLSDINVHKEIAGDGAFFFPLKDSKKAAAMLYSFLMNTEEVVHTVRRGDANVKKYTLEKMSSETLTELLNVIAI
jgi:glycosyltransferase involved in cell wall biosynthesis